ncbi:catalase family protein [Parenemella sanctibonifatiensis]|uniref:Catalase n=1 Tax=Parenemella sanctibonifatiensis TaxID=2016505 RepID=A0A255EGM0_9ACTN|nr:catalase family protein [Parenemella sanctibonifatiensis]OYN90677.1 catalase [Parenemella sanctibonifatiensis]
MSTTPGSAARYLRYAPEVEQRQPGEAEDVAALREIFAELRAFAFEKHRHGLRDAHAKSHGVVLGTLRVRDNLPDELAQGLFAQPREYPVVIRFSTAPGDIVPDGVGTARGMAIKVLEVDGAKVLAEEADARTQDFLLVNHPTISSGDVHTYRRDQAVLLEAAKGPDQVQVAAGSLLREVGGLLRRIGINRTGGPAGQAMPHTHLLGETYWSQGALRFGEHVAKVSAAPVSPNLTALTGQPVDAGEPSALRDLTNAFFAGQQGIWELRVQLATDLDVTPVEDASVTWPEDVTPYRTVAELSVESQDSYDPALRVWADDTLSFNPWHCLVEHQPLGSIQRVRRPVYDDSSAERHQLNNRPRHEPAGLQDIPDRDRAPQQQSKEK